MPTNTSTPKWCCDVCGTNFDDNYDKALACEQSPPVETLAVGDLVLSRDHSGFHLQTVTESESPVHGGGYRSPGHTSRYHLDGRHEPVTAGLIVPHAPGRLSARQHFHHGDRAYSGHRGPRSDDRDGEVYQTIEALAVVHPANAERWADGLPHAWKYGPIPETMRVAFGACGVRFEPFTAANVWGAAAGWALDLHAGSKWRAFGWLVHQDPAWLTEQMNDRLERWVAGEPVECYNARPVDARRYSARNKLSPSKLSKDQKELVAAVDVEWAARRDQSDWARECLTTLEINMEPDQRLFEPMTVAVVSGKGGVGKTTVASGLAVAAASAGQSVVIFDFDLDNPNQGEMWQVAHQPPPTSDGKVLPSATSVNGVRVLSISQMLSRGQRITWDDAPRVRWVEFVAEQVDLTDVDLVILDLPPGWTTIHERLSCDWTSRHVDCWLNVTTGHRLSLDTLARFCGNFGFDKRGANGNSGLVLVENLSVADVDVDGTTRRGRLVGEDGAVEKVAKTYHHTYGGSLPYRDTPVELGSTGEAADLYRTVLSAAASERVPVDS